MIIRDSISQGEGSALPTRDIVDGAAAPRRTAKELTEMSKELGLQDAVTVLPLDKETVRIRFNEQIAFKSGMVELSPQSLKLMDRLAISFLRPEVIEIRIEGHTDEMPPRGSSYPSNWELSATRAMSVFHALAQRGVARSRMIAGGMGDKHPLEDRPDLDRRVDITLKFRPVSSTNAELGPMQKHHRPAIQAPRH